MEINPYAAPRAPVEGSTPVDQDPATIERRAHIEAEHSLRSYGSRMVFFGGFLLFFGMIFLLGAASELAGSLGLLPPPKSTLGLDRLLPLVLVLGCMGGGLIGLGRRLRELRPSARIPATVLAGVATVLLFPVGTVVGAHLLVQLWGARGRRVLGPDYDRLVAATPHVVFERSRAVPWSVVALLLGFLGLLASFLL